jgi:AbrB family transcriptional regulator (stage V sporulation protein T)
MMNLTGITRCMDDLGRVVIPREIRRSLKLREGDTFEMCIDPVSNMVGLKKVDVHDNVCKDLSILIETYQESVSAVESEILKEALSRLMSARVNYIEDDVNGKERE